MAAEQRVPISGMLELTGRCNLDCIHCYLGPSEDRQARREMTTGEVLGLLDEIARAGCLYLTITGGDPMIRKDFPEIYRRAKKLGMIVTVFCDGILITEEIIELFRQYVPYEVDISVYGASAETYEGITRRPGSFGGMIRGIERLRRADIPFALKTVLMDRNKHEIDRMRMMADDMGARSFRVDSAIFPCFSGDRTQPIALRVPPEEAVGIELADPRTVVQWIKYTQRVEQFPDDDRLYICGAGVTGFYIDPKGNVSPCLMTTNYTYPLLHSGRSFSDLWEHELHEIQGLKTGEDFACRSCDARAACTGCPAFNYQETGNEEEMSDYICQTARLRFESLRRHLDNGEGRR